MQEQATRMAKRDGKRTDRPKERGRKTKAVESSAPDQATANATTLPGTREELMRLWQAARRRRQAAALGSEPFDQASAEIARIEVEIARIERAMDPPRV